MISRGGLALFLAFLVAACGKSEPPQYDMADSGPAIWEVTSADGVVEGWLFGTVHALPDGVAWRTRLLDQTIDRADLLVVEVAGLNDRDDLAQIFTGLAYDRNVPPLASRVDPGLRERADELVGASSIGRRQLDSMESWAAALTLAQAARTANSENGVDRALMNRFPLTDVVELEGALAQLSIFDRLPEKEQRDLLDSIILQSETSEADMTELAETWRTGNIDTLTSLAMRGMLEDPELYEALLAGRNRAWVEKLETLLTRPERPLVAVGAAHMLGEDGLPVMLAEKGYGITRIQ